jgi:hypothetical protein
MALTTTLSAAIQIADAVTNNLLLNKTLASLSFSGSVSTVAESVSVGTGGGLTVALPASPTQVVYVRNTHATQTLAVTWTPTGGSTAAVLTLQPGAYILFGEVNSTSGITALSLVGSGAGTTCEYILVA